MTVKQFKEILEDLPDDMNIVVETSAGAFTTTCVAQSDIESLQVEDEYSPDGFSIEAVFVVRPCSCNIEDIPVVPDIHENLN